MVIYPSILRNTCPSSLKLVPYKGDRNLQKKIRPMPVRLGRLGVLAELPHQNIMVITTRFAVQQPVGASMRCIFVVVFVAYLIIPSAHAQVVQPLAERCGPSSANVVLINHPPHLGQQLDDAPLSRLTPPKDKNNSTGK